MDDTPRWNDLSTLSRLVTVLVVVAALAMAFVAFAYHHDAEQLQEFYTRSTEAETKLHTLEICLDMQTHPERYKGSSLKLPCDLGPDALEYWIPEYENTVNDWHRTIREREALIRAHREGPFGFLARMVE